MKDEWLEQEEWQENREEKAGRKEVYNHPKRIWEDSWIEEGKRKRLFLIVKVSNLDNWVNDDDAGWDMECQEKTGFMKKILNYFGHDEFNVPM